MAKKIEPYNVGATESVAEETKQELTTNAQSSMGLGTISGEIEQGDIIIPRLNIVQNVGELDSVVTRFEPIRKCIEF